MSVNSRPPSARAIAAALRGWRQAMGETPPEITLAPTGEIRLSPAPATSGGEDEFAQWEKRARQ